MLRAIDKLFAVFVCMPPLYFMFRFLRWYIKQEATGREEVATE
jgi:hypothetical protein